MEMQMNNGWIKISRGITEHWLWEDAERLKWWIDLLMLAAWENKKKLVQGRLVEIERGQAIISVRSLQERWSRKNKKGEIISRPSKTTISNFLSILEQEKMIFVENRGHQITMLTICNYERYQANDKTCRDTDGDTDRDTDGDSNGDEIKNIKNIKNNNNDVESARARDTREEQFLDELHNDAIWANVVRMKFRLTADQLSARLDAFALDMQCQAKTHGTLRDMKSHFTNWLRIQIENETKQQNYERNGWQYANNAVGKRAAAEDERRRRQQEAVDYLRERLGAAVQGTVQDTSGIHDDLHPGQTGDLLPF